MTGSPRGYPVMKNGKRVGWISIVKISICAFIRLMAVLSLTVTAGACSSDNNTSQETTILKGSVLHGEMPIPDCIVTLYRAGSTRGSGAVVLGTARTNSARRV